MYVKLIIRNLISNKYNSRRLVSLMAVLSLCIMLTIGFKESFSKRYRELGMDISTSHLQILPYGSPKYGEDSYSDHRQELSFLYLSGDLQSFLYSIDEIDEIMPVIETKAAIFDLDGDPTGYAPKLIGVDPEKYKKVLPAMNVVSGDDELKWEYGDREVPIFRPVPDADEIPKDSSFSLKDLQKDDEDWEIKKATLIRDYSTIFAFVGSNAFAGRKGDEKLLDRFNRLLEETELVNLAEDIRDSNYNWRIDDAIYNLNVIQTSADSNDYSQDEIFLARKLLLQSMFQDFIWPIQKPISLNSSYTIVVPSVKDEGRIGNISVIPVELKAYIEQMPLFFFNFYIDNAALEYYLDISKGNYTSVLIRLNNEKDTSIVEKKIENWLSYKALDYKIKNSNELGKLYLTVSVAVDIITTIIMLLYVATVIVFIVNSVTLLVLKRRKDIGIAVTVGLSLSQNCIIIFGEIISLVIISWAIGSFFGVCIEIALEKWGVPGLMYFPDNKLYYYFQMSHAIKTLYIILASATISAAFVLFRIVKKKPIELLREGV